MRYRHDKKHFGVFGDIIIIIIIIFFYFIYFFGSLFTMHKPEATIYAEKGWPFSKKKNQFYFNFRFCVSEEKSV